MVEARVREKLFLVTGPDFYQKQRDIAGIKRKIFQHSGKPLKVLKFYSKEIGKKVSIAALKEDIFTLSFSGIRLLVFRDCLKLPLAAKNFIVDDLEKILAMNYILFETEEKLYRLQGNKKFSSDDFVNSVLRKAQSSESKSKVKVEPSLWNLSDSLRNRDLVTSLKTVEILYEISPQSKTLGPSIIGLIVKNFPYPKQHNQKEKCLDYLWEADRAIKEKGIASRLIIETLLVKLLDFS